MFPRHSLRIALVSAVFVLAWPDGPRLLADPPKMRQLRIQKVPTVEPPPFTALGWQVADIDAMVASLSAAGITFERYPFMPQDAMGIWTAPGGTRVAWFKDPDGNLLSLAEHGDA